MKAVILAGGVGSRLSEETILKPKPMVQIGGKPILWHVMKIYSAHGINDFIICLGYKGYLIKEYFANYFLHMSDVTFNMKTNGITVHQKNVEPWTVTLVDTGDNTQTGGRLKRIRQYLDGGAFCFTYGDGVSNVDITQLVAFHEREGRLSTVTVVQPPGRFGATLIENNRILAFTEKPKGDDSWINDGFFVLSPKVLDYIDGDSTLWEREPMETLAKEKQMSAFRHNDFWLPMDTLRDRDRLEKLWDTGAAPWKIWE